MAMQSHAMCLMGICVLSASAPLALAQSAHPSALGLFTGQSDVGNAALPGSGAHDAADGTYTLISSGGNTWFHVDGFHFLWKKAAGDMALTAAIAFPPRTYAHEPSPHRKGILMFRQTLDAGSAYAGLAVHGSGMTSLQYRAQRGANTQDIELNIDAPTTVRIEKRGDVFTLYLSAKGEPLHPVGASVALHLAEPFYVGLGAVSHDAATVDKIEFSHVALEPLAPAPPRPSPTLHSTLLTVQIQDQLRRAMVIRTIAGYMQSPNWVPGNAGIYVREQGRVVRIPYLDPPAGGEPQTVAIGSLADCTGNFGVSPDGRWLAMSCAQTERGQHEVFVLPVDGGTPRQITAGTVPAHFHAWSPDGRTIAFTRGSESKADIFTVAAAGGGETQLTRDASSDGPDFSPDGKFIYFDSSRSGGLQIWRMHPDGSAPEQITDDANRNCTPHVSPDGKHIAFFSQPANAAPGIGAAALKVMASADGFIRTLVEFQGDRGSSWTFGWGDADHLAFISYQMIP